MKRITSVSAGLASLAALAVACTGELPSRAEPSDPELAKGGPAASAGYTVLDVGALIPGSSSSEAHGVNDAGSVVGFYYSGTEYRPFALVSGSIVSLGSGPGVAWGMSNGNPAFVVGSGPGTPARWSLADPSTTLLLERTAAEITEESGGAAKGVNTAGAAVGYVAATPAMWAVDGSRLPLPMTTPAGYARGEGRGINDAGLAIFQFVASGGNSETAVSRAYLRLASGTPIELPPVGTDVTTYANDISEVVNDAVYIAGSTRSSDLVSRSVRWTVDAVSGAITATDVLETTGSHGLGVSDAGGIAGFIDIGSFRSSSYLWRGTSVLKLGPPKGSKDPHAWAMSRSGQYVAGDAVVGATRSAVRWMITTP